MALSNWDTLAVDFSGKSCEGIFKAPSGVEVEIYKNWLYVRDEKGWQSKPPTYIHPTVMEISEGCLQYKDVHIMAIRGPQSGVFAVVYAGEYGKELGIVGMGVSGYDYPSEGPCEAVWVGVRPSTAEWFQDKLRATHTRRDIMRGGGPVGPNGEFRDTASPMVCEEHDIDAPEIVRTLELTVAKRFNQGDAYFAKHLGEPVPSTVPGKSEPTILSNMIEQMKKDTPT